MRLATYLIILPESDPARGLLKIASAILTDTGGLTSHAAIVSRELNVPCLVGTKVATHLLKNGDIVEDCLLGFRQQNFKKISVRIEKIGDSPVAHLLCLVHNWNMLFF